MNSLEKKRIDRIYNSINKIAIGGKSNLLLYKNLVDVILSEREELDENLGIHSAKNLSIPFKFAFNTLLINNIIKKL